MGKNFFTPKKLAQLCVMLIWVGALVALFANSVDRRLLWVGLAIAVVALILRTVIVRCPTCGTRLTDMKSVPDRCPHCGEKLD